MEVAAWDGLPTELSWKEKIAYLGVMLAEMPGVANECPVEHSIGHGLYIRRMRIPAGTIFLGREHLVGHEVALLQGSLIWILEDGSKREVHAVKNIHTTPGFHAVCFTTTNVLVQTTHPVSDNSHDVDALEARIFGPSESLRELGLSVRARLRIAA